MQESTSIKELIFWFIFLLVALGATFWLIKYAKETFENSDNFVFTKTIAKKPKNLTITIPNFDPVNINIDQIPLVYDYQNFKIFPYAVSSGGSGNFVYLVLASINEDELKYVDSLFVGDRINPVSFEQLSDKLVFNYQAHGVDQPMVAFPNMPSKLEFQIVNNKFFELAKYFNTDSNSVVLIKPLPNASVNKKIDLEFKAGGWLFENSSVVSVYSEDYQKLFQGYGTSLSGDWMTSGLININSSLDVGNYKGKARIILTADNPSGIPEKNKSVEFWVNVQ